MIGRLGILVLASAMSLGCNRGGEGVSTQVAGEFKVTLLFETDDAKVYRFYDHGHPRYYVISKHGGPATASSSIPEGESRRAEEIHTD